MHKSSGFENSSKTNQKADYQLINTFSCLMKKVGYLTNPSRCNIFVTMVFWENITPKSPDKKSGILFAIISEAMD